MEKIKLLAEKLTKTFSGEDIFGSRVNAGINSSSTSSSLTRIVNGKKEKCLDVRFKDGSFAFTK